MKKLMFLFLLVFGVNYTYSQLDSTSINHNFVIDTSSDPDLDTLFSWGDLSISFEVSDTLNFGGVQIEIDDENGNPVKNEIYQKADIVSNGSYVVPNTTIDLGTIVKANYVARLTYLNLDLSESDPIIYNIILP